LTGQLLKKTAGRSSQRHWKIAYKSLTPACPCPLKSPLPG
jgi:hypothetical protein